FVSLSTTCSAPISTFSPYTTLFRSSDRLAPQHRDLFAARGPLRALGGRHADRPPVSAHARRAGRVRGAGASGARGAAGCGAAAGDRKSTRLNSSHVKISYAVFCLKK